MPPPPPLPPPPPPSAHAVCLRRRRPAGVTQRRCSGGDGSDTRWKVAQVDAGQVDWSRAGAGQIDASARSTLQLERSVTGPIANQPSSRRSRRYTIGLQSDRWGCRWLADTFPDVSGTRKLTQEAQKKKLGKKFKRRSSSFYTY